MDRTDNGQNHGFRKFPQNRDFLRKIKVVESVPIRSYTTQGMQTRRETTPRHPGCVLLAPHAAVRAEQVRTLGTVPRIPQKLAKNQLKS